MLLGVSLLVVCCLRGVCLLLCDGVCGRYVCCVVVVCLLFVCCLLLCCCVVVCCLLCYCDVVKLFVAFVFVIGCSLAVTCDWLLVFGCC